MSASHVDSVEAFQQDHWEGARVVDSWNELDDSTVSADSVTAFNRKPRKLCSQAVHHDKIL